LVEAKIKNLPAPEPEVEKKAPKVVDLMEALRRSLAQVDSSQGGVSRAAGETAETSSAAKSKTARTTAAKRKKSA
jgi:non-homologous end joining protein Ku